jgi:hypothetical protein
LPWPRIGVLDRDARGHRLQSPIHTGFGEEGAKSLIGILLLALLSEVTIGLEVVSTRHRGVC